MLENSSQEEIHYIQKEKLKLLYDTGLSIQEAKPFELIPLVPTKSFLLKFPSS